MKEQWPQSYLDTFDPFVADQKSVRYANALVDAYLKGSTFSENKGTVHILDIFCGTGNFGRAIEDHLKSIGSQTKMGFLDASSKILEGIQLNTGDSVICANVAAMPEIPSASYDIIVCRYGFNNLEKEQWLKALDEVLRILKPGGIFVLQDHFVPGPVFSALVNEAEQFLAKLEGKSSVPFIYSTEAFNDILDRHPLVYSRVKAGYGLFINIWDRLHAKKEIIPDFEAAKQEILKFYKKDCLEKYKLLIVDPEEYIHVYNITYAIVKCS